MNYFKIYTVVSFLLYITACELNSSKDTNDSNYEYFYHRKGNQIQVLKLKFNFSKTEVVEAYFKPYELNEYLPLIILAQNDTPFYYLVRYSQQDQLIQLFTDFGAGASLFFSPQNFITFNKEYKIISNDKKSVLITSGLPSFTPFFLTDIKFSYIYQFLPSNKDSINVVSNPNYPNSIVFQGTFTNGKDAKITIIPEEKKPLKFTFIVEIENEKIVFNQNFE